MANIKCSGNIESQTIDTTTINTQNINTNGIQIANGFSALNNIGGGFKISDTSNVGLEIGRVDGTAGNPYIDFHTDGSSSTDYNVRMLASGNQLSLTASGGFKVNSKDVGIIDSYGSNFIRFTNGLQICWGQTSATSSTGALSVSLPKAFLDTNYGLSVSVVYAGNNWSSQIYVYLKTTSNFQYYKYSAVSVPTTWIAVGKWK